MYITYIIVVLIVSVIVHEVAHGVVALRCGDTTAKDAGRVTLNPIPHIHIFGSIILPGILIFSNVFFGLGIILGWAKPVPINPHNFNKTRTGLFFVSIAGIVTNFSIAILAALLMRVFDGDTIGPVSVFSILFPFVLINLILGFGHGVDLDGNVTCRRESSIELSVTFTPDP